jgi:tetratricopeptide (TPR) repeat protein/tRNA A-37 threonylcarbamoyl transferase component Bud32
VTAPAGRPFRIGPYTVIGTLGRGGMGMVYAAYDDKLDRKVALKQLHSLQDTGTSGRGRMLREAQALARVSHPNVVQVYEVGEYEQEIYIAMEFVRGETLRSWLRARPRSWREVLAVFLQAGRGLVAAHAAGVIHRDFKPDNVMIGDDGRVRVMDFGLARATGRADVDPEYELPAHDSALSATLTAAGTLLGTPAYMAPEQFAGAGEIDVHADQFAYCVALFEALYGQRPFAGHNIRALADNIRRGEIRQAPRRGAPRWLRQIVTRGLAVAPAQRWPRMAALLTRIERGQRLARLRLFVALLTFAGLAALAGWAFYRADLAARHAACEAAGAELDLAWNDATRAQLRESFVAADAADAAATVDRVIPWLDRHADAWKRARADACIDTDIHHTWTADTLDHSSWCLEERRMEFESLVAELSRADRMVVQKAVPAAAGLDPVGPCRDAAALARLPIPPAEGRDEARAVRAELARSSNLHAAGKFGEARETARAALTRAEGLAWLPLTAAARLRLGLALDRLAASADAARELEEAGFAAMEAGALGVAADAAIALVTLTGQKLTRFDDAARWSRLAGLALRELEPRPGLRTAANLIGLATVRSLTGDLAGANALQRQALAIQEEALGPDHLQVAATLQALTTSYMHLAAFPEALAASERSLKIRESVLGPTHGDVARSLTNQGLVLRRMGDYPASLAMQVRAAAVTEQALGPEHPDLAVVLTNLANIHLLMGSLEQARAPQERALAIREAALGPEHPEVAASLSNLGIYFANSGDLARAREVFKRALAIREKVFGGEHPEVVISLVNLAGVNVKLAPVDALPQLERALALNEKLLGPEHPSLVTVLINLSHLDLEAGRFEAARARCERGVAIVEKAQGPKHPELALPLLCLARALLRLGRATEAVEPAARSLAVSEALDPAAPGTVEVKFDLARALWDAPNGSGRDRKRALELARAARDGLRGAAGYESEHAAIVRWLAKRRG